MIYLLSRHRNRSEQSREKDLRQVSELSRLTEKVDEGEGEQLAERVDEQGRGVYVKSIFLPSLTPKS